MVTRQFIKIRLLQSRKPSNNYSENALITPIRVPQILTLLIKTSKLENSLLKSTFHIYISECKAMLS